MKFCECLKINAKFRDGCAIFGTSNLWNFYVKYYKTFIQKLKKKCKKYYLIVSAACLYRVISFTFLPFGVSSLFCHTAWPFARIGLIKYIRELTESVLTVASITWWDIHLLWLGMMFPRAMRWDKNSWRASETRWIYPSHFVLISSRAVSMRV